MLLLCVGDEGGEEVEEQPLPVKTFTRWLWMPGSCQGAGDGPGLGHRGGQGGHG